MRFLTPLLMFLSTATLSSCSIFRSSQSHILDDETFPVPGENPLGFCKDPEDYILTVDYVDLSPNPPKPGDKLTIKANGTFSEQVEEGATVFLQVKFNKYITLIKTEQDLCTNLGKIDIECPLKNSLYIEKEVNIPGAAPKGVYEVLAEVRTSNKDIVTCMQGQVDFRNN